MKNMKTVAFIGGGSFGTALSTVLAGKGCRVNIFDIDQDHLARMEAAMENTDYLPGVKLVGDYHFCKTNEEALSAGSCSYHGSVHGSLPDQTR